MYLLAQLVLAILVVTVLGCSAGQSTRPVSTAPQPGTQWRDCAQCPLLVTIPTGVFDMGTPAAEPGRLAHEGPVHQVTIANAFALGKFEVTFAQWDACVDDGGCNYYPADEGTGRGLHPVMNINLDEMHAYLHWLTVKTGNVYRLPTEAEWEYAARAGSVSAYAWGAKASHEFANYGADTCCEGTIAGRDVWLNQAAPVGSFPANQFGLHDMHGNVYERVRDCWTPSYDDAPTDGSASLTGDCRALGLRGGAWVSSPALLRAGERDAFNGYYRSTVMGFRVVRELDSAR
jgi:formylglycine-generating enzyme required for sulfatase activity